MKTYFGKKNHMRLTALVLMGLLYGSTASADTNGTITAKDADATGGVYTLTQDETRNLTKDNHMEGLYSIPKKFAALTNYHHKIDNNKHAFQDFTIDLKGHTWTLGVTSKQPPGPASAVTTIFAGPENKLTVKDSAGGGKLVLSATVENGTASTVASAIWVQSPMVQQHGSATVTFETPVEITSVVNKRTGDYGSVYGVYAGTRADVTFKKLTMRDVAAEEDKYTVGLDLNGGDAKITADEVDIAGVKGDAVRLDRGGDDGEDEDGKISIKGGKIVAAADSTNTKKYYAVHGIKGTISLNESQDRDFTVVGNMWTEESGIINASFTSAASHWKGAVYRKGGEMNLTLMKGGKWIHEVQSGDLATNTAFTGSHLNKLTGGTSMAPADVGVVQQGMKDITIDSYSGNTRFLFEHDATTPTMINGGKVTITEAEPNSHVVFSTAPSPNITAANQADVLNALANKLQYTDFKNGKQNLKGTAEINEGLISSSAQWKGDITFDGTTGDGSYREQKQSKENFTTPITNIEAEDTEYKDDFVRRDDGSYVFTKDKTTITTSGKQISDGGYGGKTYAAISNTNTTKPLQIDMAGHDLAVRINKNDHATGIGATGKDSTVVINNAGNMDIESVSTAGKNSAALFAAGGGKISIQAHEGKTLKLRARSDNAAKAAVVKAINSRHGVQSSIDINGAVDIEADGIGSKEAVNSTGAIINMKGGGTIRATGTGTYAIHSAGDQFGKIGHVYVNVRKDSAGNVTEADDKKTVVEGNLSTSGMGGQGVIHLGLYGTGSSWTGDYLENGGTVNLWLGYDRATWTGKTGTNSDFNLNMTQKSLWKVTGSSHIANLKGPEYDGGGYDSEALVDLRATQDSDKVNIDAFEGKTHFLYDNVVTQDPDTNRLHVAAKGAEIHVKKAKAGSEITLWTAANGAWNWKGNASNVDMNITDALVKSLVNKFWFEDAAAHADNLKLKVRIGEGLTTSSQDRLIWGGIHYDTANGGRADYTYTPRPEPRPVTAIRAAKILTKDFTAVSEEANAADDHGNMHVSALYAGNTSYNAGNPMIVNMNGHSLNLEVLSRDKAASGVMLRPNAAVEVQNAAGKELTIKANNESSTAAHGIYLAENSSLKLQGPVVVEQVTSEGREVTGIRTEGANSKVEIDGTLTIHSLQENLDGDGSRVSALDAHGEGSSITVTGDADIRDVRGTVLSVYDESGQGKGGTIRIAGGSLSAIEAGPSYQFRLVKQNAGTVHINMQTDGTAGTRKTNLYGDVYVTGAAGSAPKGTLNVALTTNDSSWHGASLYEDTATVKAGNFNLWLQNGASWKNEQLSVASSSWQGSHVSKLVGGTAGHEGMIFQKDAKPITIDQYSGHLKVFYRHTVDGQTPTIKGGDLTIGHADAGSEITLVTDNDSLDVTSTVTRKKNLVSATLNALAKKLWYTAFKSGENTLTGRVMIADGLTGSSASLRLENITFDHSTGQGGYIYTPAVLNQTVTSFTTPITGNQTTDTAYVTGGVMEEGEYTFSKDTTITGANGIKGTSANKILAAVSEGKTLSVQASDAALDAGAGSDIALSGGKTVMETTGSHVIRTAAGSKTALKGAFDIKGAVQNAGALTLDDKEKKSNLAGDIDNSGTLTLSLKGTGSTYSGAIRGSGTSSLALGGAARWTNTGASALQTFAGTAGSIVDMRSSGDTRIANYSGNSVFWYGHTIADGVDRDGEQAKVPTIVGGKLTIASAAMGSEIHLRTDSTGYDFTSTKLIDENLIHATLNGLANKLYYENYATQPTHLKAYVEIGEGLIGSGAHISKEITTFGKTSDATDGTDFQGKPFNTENGQGAYIYNVKWEVPETQQATDFTAPITGDWDGETKKGADRPYARGGVIHDGKYGFTKDTKIHPAAGSGITNAASKKDITIKAQGANLTVEAAEWAIEAAKDHKIDLTSDKRVTLNGRGVLSAASSSAVNVEAAGLTLNGDLQNDGGKVTLDGGNAKSTFAGNLSQSGGGSLTMNMKGDGSSFAGNVLNLGGSVRIDLSGAGSSFRGTISGPADTAGVSGLRSAKAATLATTELILGKAANVEFTGASKVKLLTVGENSVVKAPDGKELKVDTLNTGSGSTVTAQTGATLTAGALAANGSLKLAADGNIRTDKLTMSGGTIQKVGSGTAAVKEAEVTKETTLDAATAGMSFDKLSLGNAMLKNAGAADIAVKKLSSNTGGRLFLGSDAKVQAEEISGTINVLKQATKNSDGTITANNGKLIFKKVDAAQTNKLTLSAVGMTLEDARTGTAEEQKAKKERNQNALLSLYNQTVQADVGSEGIVKGNTYKDAEGKERQGYRIKNLNVNLATMESLTGSSATAFGNVLFDSSGKAASVAEQQIGYGDYETMVMQSTKGAMTSTAMVWRNEMNDVMKRMGDLRLSPENMGAWVHFYRGKTSSDKDKANFRMDYTTIQVGYDWKAGKDWRVGVAGSYMKGSSSYATGSGDNKAGNLAVYGTWTGKSGEYVDVIAKVGRMANDFSVSNAWGNVTAQGDYHTWGESVSAEYGRRFHKDNGYYYEPQIEMTFGHLNGASYEMTSNGHGTLQVDQSGLTSVIGRLGIAMGQETKRSTWFLKASLYHEFAGDMDTTWKVTGNPTKYTKQDGKDTWLGIQLGGTMKLSDNTSLYGDFEKTFGGDIKTDWRIDAGLRWSF